MTQDELVYFVDTALDSAREKLPWPISMGTPFVSTSPTVPLGAIEVHLVLRGTSEAVPVPRSFLQRLNDAWLEFVR